MKLLRKPLIRKCKLEDLTIDNLFIAVPYLYDDNTNEYKMELNIGGMVDFTEWYTSDDFILLSEIDKDFYVKDINKLTGKQRSYIYFKYKNYLETKGGCDMKNLRTKEVAELFGLTLNQMNGLFYNTIPKQLRPEKAQFSDGGNGYYYTDKDLEIIEKAIKYKKTMKNKEVKDKLEREYLVSSNANNSDTITKSINKVTKPVNEINIHPVSAMTYIDEQGNYKTAYSCDSSIKVHLTSGEVLKGRFERFDDKTITLFRLYNDITEVNDEKQTYISGHKEYICLSEIIKIDLGE